jgi:hypothetical protein
MSERSDARGGDFIYSISGGDRFRSAAVIDTRNEEHMRKAARTDANQAEIVDALRAVGCAVAITSSAGDGFPDLVVSRRERGAYRPTVYLIECKDGQKAPSERALTPAQKRFHAEFAGCCYVANSVSDALAIVGLGPKAAA